MDPLTLVQFGDPLDDVFRQLDIRRLEAWNEPFTADDNTRKYIGDTLKSSLTLSGTSPGERVWYQDETCGFSLDGFVLPVTDSQAQMIMSGAYRDPCHLLSFLGPCDASHVLDPIVLC